jgi:hypothetical protein
MGPMSAGQLGEKRAICGGRRRGVRGGHRMNEGTTGRGARMRGGGDGAWLAGSGAVTFDKIGRS